MDELERRAETPDTRLTVVGVGVSAGGLEALTELPQHLPSMQSSGRVANSRSATLTRRGASVPWRATASKSFNVP
jgi:chemotaxis response regulator CheB